MEIIKTVHASDVDFEAKMSVFAIANTVQDMITETLGEDGSDNVTLREKYHCMWVFSKSKFCVRRRPHWCEKIKVTCRSVMAKRLTNVMEVRFFDMDGGEIAECYVEMCVIDVNTFRFVKLTDIPFTYPQENIDIKFSAEEYDYDDEYPVEVNAANIDYSRHLNNTQSINMYLATLTPEQARAIFDVPFVFDIKFSAQARMGDALKLKRAEREVHGYSLVGADGKSVVTASVKAI